MHDLTKDASRIFAFWRTLVCVPRALVPAILQLLFVLVFASAANAQSNAFQQDSGTGLLSIELENFDTYTAQGGHAWTQLSSGGASGGAVMEATPNTGTNNNTGFESSSPRLDYLVNFTQTGTHYIWIRGQGASVDDSLHVGLNGSAQSTSDRVTGFTANGWTWSDETMDSSRARIEVTAPGEQVLNIWMREDGTRIDKVVLTTNASLVPDSFGATGPAESLRGAPQPALQFDTGTASFSVDEGATSLQTATVTLAASDGQPTGYVLASSQPAWLSTTPTSGTTPAGSITIEADPSGLSAGVYTGTITATASGYLADTIAVTLTVQADLFVSSGFDNPDVSDWTVVESSGDPMSWQVVDGAFRQLNPASATIAGNDAYLLGTYAFLNSQTAVDDFEFSVEITPEATGPARRGDDVGIMFRYVDDDNYYRLTVNSKFGQTRLERRIAGQFSTMAVTSQGYLPDQVIRVGVRMQGPAMLIYRDYGGTSSVLDGEPYFAGYDSTHAAGSVALYTQSEAAFDDVLLRSLGTAPHVGMVAPVPFAVDTDDTVAAQAVVLNASGSVDVGFEIDGVACGATSNPQPALFEADCAAVMAGEHVVESVMRDPIEVDRDEAPAVATGGLRAVTLGNSITSGFGDQFIPDNIGVTVEAGGTPVGPRQVAFRGYQTVLSDQLAADAGFTRSMVAFNEGVPGDRSDQLAFDRLPSILERHADINAAYVMIGTNDANRSGAIDSGLGCSGASCSGTFKGYLLDIVDVLQTVGVEPVFARIPPIFGQGGTAYPDPLSGTTRNATVQAYNDAIGEVIAEQGLEAGPDFFAEFLGDGENRNTLFEDFLHPNSLGYVWMANAWKQVVSPDGTVPFILDGICVRRNSSACVSPTPYKQNLRAAGDSYYLDRTYTLTSIPAALDGGVWIIPENDDKPNAREDYLEFTVDRDVDVYVAFTPTATTLPNWMGPFSDTGESIGVTAGTPLLDLYSRFYGAGSTVTLGGNVAAGLSGGGNNNFVVIVVPR
jgi:lysophospholipase L1-like esterase